MSAPTIRILRPGDEQALEAFLLPRVETSMFLIGNMRSSGLVDRGRPYQGTYAAAFERGRVTGVVAHCWNGNLLFQAPNHRDRLWRVAVASSGRPIGGLIGPDEQVSPVKEALGITQGHVQMDELDKLYRLELDDLIVPDGLRSGHLAGRRIEPRDVDLVTEWRVAFCVEALGTEDTPELRTECRATVERHVNEGVTWILENVAPDRAQPVAISSFNTRIEEAVQIGGVWTPPEFRRRGYGRSAVAASLLDARAEGAGMAILFTAKENLAAQKAYEALGFHQVGTYRLLLLREPVEFEG